MKAIFPGSFDPLHNGHLSIIEQAIEKGYSLIVLVAINENKNYENELSQRFELVRNELSILDVEVDFLPEGELTPNYAKLNNIETIIRGTRNDDDKKYEDKLQKKYLSINPDLKFVYFKTSNDISSTKLKQR